MLGGQNNFRRVELAVMLVTVGLLLAGLGAVGKANRERARRTICLANQGHMVRGWLTFTEENNGYLPVGFVINEFYYEWLNDVAHGRKGYPLWCNPPHDADWNYLGSKDGPVPTLEDRKRGCRTGALYPYIKNAEVYHCPSDRRFYEGIPAGDSAMYHAFRSYSLPDGLMGETYRTMSTASVQAKDMIKKFRTLAKPETKYCFLDAPYDLMGANFNYDGWGFEPVIGLDEWWDNLATFHNNGTTLAFCDGRAEYYQWKDERSIIYHNNRDDWGRRVPQPGNVDIEWFVEHYPINEPYTQ